MICEIADDSISQTPYSYRHNVICVNLDFGEIILVPNNTLVHKLNTELVFND